MYFKIKTTGLNPHKDSIYLIAWMDSKGKNLQSLFLPCFNQEIPFLEGFLAQAPRSITSFRGSQFDLKFLNRKLQDFQLKHYRPDHRDLWQVQENLEKFHAFPGKTRASWQLYYTKSPGLGYKNEKKYLKAYYEGQNPEAKEALIQAVKEELSWYKALDLDLQKLEKDLALLDRYQVESLDLLADTLLVQGKTSLKDQENHQVFDSLTVRDSVFSYQILLNKGTLEDKEAYYILCPPLKRLGLKDLPLEDQVLVLVWGQNYFKEDILQVLKNRLQKLELL